MKQSDATFQLLNPTSSDEPAPNCLNVNSGRLGRSGTIADLDENFLRGTHSPERLDNDSGLPLSQEPPAFQAGAEPSLDRYDARHYLLVEPAVEFGLLGLAQEYLRTAELVVVTVEVKRGEEVSYVVLRT